MLLVIMPTLYYCFLPRPPWEDPKSRTPQIVPYSTIESFLGTLKGIYFLDLPRGLEPRNLKVVCSRYLVLITCYLMIACYSLLLS